MGKFILGEKKTDLFLFLKTKRRRFIELAVKYYREGGEEWK